MILDAETLEPAPAVETLVRGSAGLALPGRLKTELFASIVELETEVCESAPAATAAVRRLRAAAAELAAANGLAVAATGTHPTAVPERQAIVREPRYLELVEHGGITMQRQGVSGLHVHVGMPSAEACHHVLEAVLPWLPLVLALSANSPYLAGAETGLASNRAEVLAQLPRSGAPPAFRNYGEWESFVRRLIRLGVTTDYTTIWWDVRPHPRLGTLEVRMPDQPTEPAKGSALVALVTALCVWGAREPWRPPDPAGRGLYAESRWAALRFGPRAQLVHPDGERLATVGELHIELLERLGPVVAELGLAEALLALDPLWCEGDDQLEVGRSRGLRAVSADLCERTLRSI